MPNNGVVQLSSGRVLHLYALRQWEVYEGLLEGAPTVERNKKTVEHVLKEESAAGYGAVYRIRPVETPLPYHGGKHPFGEPASLPSVGCVGRFKSLQPARDKGQDYSTLTVVWFQEKLAFPIERKVLKELRAIDWDQHATDYLF
jgi:hypothetical protein